MGYTHEIKKNLPQIDFSYYNNPFQCYWIQYIDYKEKRDVQTVH